MEWKRWFLKYLKELAKKEEDSIEIKGLRKELKKRPLVSFTHPKGHKTFVLVQQSRWRRNKTPLDSGWPDYFELKLGGKKDYTVLLIWLESLYSKPEEVVEFWHQFLRMGEECEKDCPYIQ